VSAEVVFEAAHVQAELAGIADDVSQREVLLMSRSWSCISQNLAWAAAASDASAAS
jgi:hypothetical protein